MTREASIDYARTIVAVALGGRPANSPGWGMLVAVRGGTFTSKRNPRERVTITAGSTSVCRGYWPAVERPELFKPADTRDTRTIGEHRGNLERTRRTRGARGRTRASGPARPRSRMLPPRGGGSALRLPHSAHARPLRLPR